MAKNKNRIPKSLTSAFVIVITASILLTSFTFAKFLSFSSTDASSSIADWNVTITPQTNDTIPSGTTYDGAILFSKLSPGPTVNNPAAEENTVEIDGTTYNYIVKNTTAVYRLATLSYTTSVDMVFSIQTSSYTINFTDGSSLNNGGVTDGDSDSSTKCYADYVKGSNTNLTGLKENNIIITKDNYDIKKEHTVAGNVVPTESDITGLFELNITCSDSNVTLYQSGDIYSCKFEASSSSVTYTFNGTLTWQVKVANYNSSYNYYWATYLCDWVGRYVESISCDITYTARQASETPAKL